MDTRKQGEERMVALFAASCERTTHIILHEVMQVEKTLVKYSGAIPLEEADALNTRLLDLRKTVALGARSLKERGAAAFAQVCTEQLSTQGKEDLHVSLDEHFQKTIGEVFNELRKIADRIFEYAEAWETKKSGEPTH